VRYLSVCSGIEAATVAWHDLGWTPVAFSEIEPFPSAVLAHHYPHVPNVGDMTKFKEWNLGPIDLLVGGTPCQSFSVAGLRKGLDDPRGNLMLTFLAIAERHRPRWIVWENVPGVLSSNGGRDFGTFLGALGELGYGWAYRVLDAQWFGVAQRRRRCFVIANLGDQAGAAAVLFESESVCRNPAPSREKRKDTTGSTGDGIARCVTAEEMKRQDWETCNMVAQPVAFHHNAQASQLLTDARDTSISDALTVSQQAAVAQPVAFHPAQDPISSVDVCHALSGGSEHGKASAAVHVAMQVRRLTPVECERLQGFPDGYTNIPWRKKDEAPDGPRYKAIGNSMAVPCMKWIGERIAKVTK
jgi:DNA (cytosine-5)-methyltransferase 1